MAAQLVSPLLTDPEIAGSSPAFQSPIARGGGRKPMSLISPTALWVAVIGHDRAIVPPLIHHTSQPAPSRLSMICIFPIVSYDHSSKVYRALRIYLDN